MLFAASMAACTYGPVEDHVNVQNVALKPDGTLLAVVVKYERYRRATGLSSFPDGGVPRILTQRADLYIIDLRSRTQLYHAELPAPPDHRVAFSPWLMGWEDDRVYFKITGCPGSPGSECYGRLVRTSVFTLSATGSIVPVRNSVSPVLTGSFNDITRYITAGVEPYGVSISTRLGSPRTPLLRFVDLRLEVVSVQSAAQPDPPL